MPSETNTTVPRSPWKPHGPVQYRPVTSNVDEWADHEKAAYIMADIQNGGVGNIDSDPWVASFLVAVLWTEVQRGVSNAE